VQLYSDDGTKVVNWPQQHYDNGVSKNTATGRRYKGVVRILKHLRNLMDAAGHPTAKPIDGFLVECLIWNVPNHQFGHTTWDADVRAALIHLWSNTRSEAGCREWGEVSELKYIFRGSPPAKREQAHAFIDAAWSLIGVQKA
jgi:hypothetical protein